MPKYRTVLSSLLSEQELDGPKISRSPINQGSLRSPQCVRSISRGIQTDLTHPVTDDAGILARGEMRRTAKPAWEESSFVAESMRSMLPASVP